MSEEQENAVIAQLDRMEAAAKGYKAKVAGEDDKRWKKYADFALGGKNHWRNYQGGLALQFTNNRLGQNLATQNALLSDMNIAAEFQPREPGDEVPAALSNILKDYIFEARNVPATFDLMQVETSVLGTGIGMTWWNPELRDGKGDVDVTFWPARNVYTEPGKHDFDDMRFMFVELWLDKAECKNKWGIKEPEGGPEDTSADMWEQVEPANVEGGGRAYNVAAAGESVPSTTTSLIPARNFFTSGEDADKFRVQQWWIRDDDHPKGRVIVRCGRHIVEDKDNYDHGKWPFFHFADQISALGFWADCTMRQAIPVQKELNVVESVIAMNLHTTTATPWVNYVGSGISNEMLQTRGNVANAVLNCRGPHLKPERMHPQPLQANLFSYRDMLLQTLDDLQGIMASIPPGARGWPQSGDVVSEMRETQLVHMRPKATNRARGVKRCVELIGATAQEFYTDKRWVRLVGSLPMALQGMVDPKDPKREQVIKTVSDHNGNETNVHYVQIKPDAIKHHLDVKIVEATWQPLSLKTQIDEFLKLNERDPEAVPISAIIEIMPAGPVKERILRSAREAEAAAKAEAEAPQPEGGMPGAAPPMPGMGMPGQPPMPGAMPPMGGGMPPMMPPPPMMGGM